MSLPFLELAGAGVAGDWPVRAHRDDPNHGIIETIRHELNKVIERVDVYLNTALPAQTPAIKVALADHQAQLAQAMKQEAARSELAQAISSARQKITALRRD